MRKFVLSVLFILTFFIANYVESATTSDGVITLDFYEDTLSGIENRWILDFTVNDIEGGVESLGFRMDMMNLVLNYDNEYNVFPTDYYDLMYISQSPSAMYQRISTNSSLTAVGSNYFFYAVSIEEGEPVVDEFLINLAYMTNLGMEKHESISLTGPIAFNAVPEPITMILFAFGAFLLKFISKKK